MRGRQVVWRAESDGGLAAEVGAYRAVVRLPEGAREAVRFLVLRLEGGDDCPPALVGSGTEEDLRAAMRKASRMLDRLVEPPGTRHPRWQASTPFGPPSAIRFGAGP